MSKNPVTARAPICRSTHDTVTVGNKTSDSEDDPRRCYLCADYKDVRVRVVSAQSRLISRSRAHNEPAPVNNIARSSDRFPLSRRRNLQSEHPSHC